MNIIILLLCLIAVYLADAILEEIRWKKFLDKVSKDIKTDCCIDNCAVQSVEISLKKSSCPKDGDVYYNAKDRKMRMYSKKNGWFDIG